MAIRYIYHGGDSSSPNTFAAGMAGAYPSLTAALTGAPVGEKYAVASDHVDPNLTGTYTFPASFVNLSEIFSIDRTTGLYSPASISAPQFQTASGVGMIWNGGIGAVSGISAWPGGGNAQTGNANWQLGQTFSEMRAKDLRITTPQNVSARVLTASSGRMYVEAPLCDGANGNTSFSPGSQLHVRGDGSKIWVAGSTIPNQVFYFGGQTSLITMENVDLSDFGSGRNIQFGMSSGLASNYVLLLGCKLNASVGITRGSAFASHAHAIDILACRDAAGSIMHQRHNMRGDVITSLSVTRQGGASDGAASMAWAFYPTAQCTRGNSLESFEVDIEIPLANVGVSTTLTFHLVYDAAVATVDDGDVTVLLMAGNASNSALSSLNRGGRPNSWDAGQALTSSSATWNGTSGMTTPTKKRIDITLTPGARNFKAQIYCGKAGVSATVPGMTGAVPAFYICPKPDIV